MSNVVITGSTKGIGRGLADEFIKRGHNVAISSRSQDDVDRVAAELSAAGQARAIGRVCDITDKSQMQALWDAAAGEFGSVDYWINNAGRATSRHQVHELPEDLVRTLIGGNLMGTVFGCQVAITGFRQQGKGNLYNMLGGSFDGKRLTPNMGVYSATKAGVYLLTKYLVAENKDQNITVGCISPGMLITENWIQEQAEMAQDDWVKIRPILNILCDYVETATPWLVDEILANQESGRRIAWMSSSKMMKRFVGARFGQKRDLFERYGL